MKKTVLVFGIILSAWLSADADSIEPRAPREIKYYAQFNELPIQKNLAAIDGRDIIIFLANDNKIWLAKMKTGQWQSFLLLENFTTDTELKIEEQQVNGSGSKELVIRWDYMGKVEFLNVIFKGVQVWNVDEAICYLDEFSIALEERYVRDSDIHYYAGCERKIEVNADVLEIESFRCDYDLGVEVIPEQLFSGVFYFSEGKYRKKETGDSHK